MNKRIQTAYGASRPAPPPITSVGLAGSVPAPVFAPLPTAPDDITLDDDPLDLGPPLEVASSGPPRWFWPALVGTVGLVGFFALATRS